MEKAYSDTFEIRSETSYSNTGKSRCFSVDSEEASAQELSYLIEEIIVEEKKRYVPSKTENRLLQESVQTLAVRRNYSISSVGDERPKMRIPRNITRILNSPKIYPGIPTLLDSHPSLDAIYGAFFGFLIGDIVGSHLAYVTRNLEEFVPNALLMNGGGTYNLGAGQGTDQTELMLCLCYGLLAGGGKYKQNLVAQQYLDWFESKPFNFSAVFALSMRELHIMKLGGVQPEPERVSEILMESSRKNSKQESSIGLIRMLPLAFFGLHFEEEDFEKLITCKYHSI